MRSLLACGLLAVLAACSASQSAPLVARDKTVASSATHTAPAAAARPKITSL